MDWILVILLGACVGSFLNAALWRLHENISIARGRSMCTSCRHVLSWNDLVPIFSYVSLRGKCRYCTMPISWQYPVVECVTAALFALAYFVHGQSHLLILRDWIFIGILIFLFVYDLRWFLLPDRITIPALFLALLFSFWIGGGSGLGNALLAGFIGAAFFFLQYALSRGEWIGGGDIRLGALMGFLLGFPQVLVALFIAYTLGSLVALILLSLKKMDMKSHMPFGPFLVTGTLTLLLFNTVLMPIVYDLF